MHEVLICGQVAECDLLPLLDGSTADQPLANTRSFRSTVAITGMVDEIRRRVETCRYSLPILDYTECVDAYNTHHVHYSLDGLSGYRQLWQQKQHVDHC